MGNHSINFVAGYLQFAYQIISQLLGLRYFLLKAEFLSPGQQSCKGGGNFMSVFSFGGHCPLCPPQLRACKLILVNWYLIRKPPKFSWIIISFKYYLSNKVVLQTTVTVLAISHLSIHSRDLCLNSERVQCFVLKFCDLNGELSSLLLQICF